MQSNEELLSLKTYNISFKDKNQMKELSPQYLYELLKEKILSEYPNTRIHKIKISSDYLDKLFKLKKYIVTQEKIHLLEDLVDKEKNYNQIIVTDDNKAFLDKIGFFEDAEELNNLNKIEEIEQQQKNEEIIEKQKEIQQKLNDLNKEENQILEEEEKLLSIWMGNIQIDYGKFSFREIWNQDQKENSQYKIKAINVELLVEDPTIEKYEGDGVTLREFDKKIDIGYQSLVQTKVSQVRYINSYENYEFGDIYEDSKEKELHFRSIYSQKDSEGFGIFCEKYIAIQKGINKNSESKIKFCCIYKYNNENSNQKGKSFWDHRIDIVFSSINKVYVNEEQTAIYIQLNVAPNMYLKRQDPLKFINPLYNDTLNRIICYPSLMNKQLDYLEQLHFSNSICIKIQFSNENMEFIQQIQQYFGNSEKIKKDYCFKKFKEYQQQQQQQQYLNEKLLQQSTLDDEIKYILLCLISQKKLNIFNLKPVFIRNQLEQDKDIVKIVLEQWYKGNLNLYKMKYIEILEKFQKDYEEAEDDQLFRNQLDYGLEEQQQQYGQVLTDIKRVVITPSREIFYYSEPELSNKIFRKYISHKNKFLRVSIIDDQFDSSKKMKYFVKIRFGKYLDEYINVLGSHYTFLGYSASQMRTYSCIFFREDQTLTCQDILNSIGNFSNIKNPAKYGARIGQSFSSSLKVTLSPTIINRIKEYELDIPSSNEKLLFSDGVGKMSKTLLEEIRQQLNIQDYICAIQMRLGGAKGVLTYDPQLNGGEYDIVLRESQIKFKVNQSSYQDLEFLEYSRYRIGYLNRQIILLLLTLGVKGDVIYKLYEKYIKNLLSNEDIDTTSKLDKLIINDSNTEFLQNLFKDLFTLKEQENYMDPFLNGLIKAIKKQDLILLKDKCNIKVEQSVRILGVLDEYGVLEENEIFMQISEDNTENKARVIESKCIITRNPCLYPGDIRVVTSVNKIELKHLINVIVLPKKGKIPLSTQISGGDLDGDLYFVSWNKDLLPLESNLIQPLPYHPLPKIFLNEIKQVTLNDVKEFYKRYLCNENLGKIDNSHLAKAEKEDTLLANAPECIQLSKIHAYAVDFPKSGYSPLYSESSLGQDGYPDYMEKNDQITFNSKSVIGQIYNQVKLKIEEDPFESEDTEKQQVNPIQENFCIQGWRIHVQFALKMLMQYYQEISHIMDQFGIESEFEIISGHIYKFKVIKLDNKKSKLENIQKKLSVFIQEFIQRITVSVQNYKNSRAIDSNNSKELSSAFYLVTYLIAAKHILPNSLQSEFDFMQEYDNFQEFNEIHLKNNPRRFLGLPWIVQDIRQKLINKSKAIKSYKIETDHNDNQN